jgi:hypothetical protein
MNQIPAASTLALLWLRVIKKINTSEAEGGHLHVSSVHSINKGWLHVVKLSCKFAPVHSQLLRLDMMLLWQCLYY